MLFAFIASEAAEKLQELGPYAGTAVEEEGGELRDKDVERLGERSGGWEDGYDICEVGEGVSALGI